jgi:protease IV
MMKNKTTIILFLLIGFCFISMIIIMFVMMLKPDVHFGNSVALIELTGPIEDSGDIVSQFKKHREDSSVRSIVFRIDSPGGGIAPSQEIYEAVKKTRTAGKPVVVSMASVAASGGYYVACPADTILANPGTITGSIGVIMQYPNIDKMLDKIGVQFTTFKSGQFKDAPSPYRDTNRIESEYLQQFIMNAYYQFISAIVQGRKMDSLEVLKLADGRIYTGQQAKANGLIDALGTLEDAIDIAARKGGIEGEPHLVKKDKRKPSLFEIMFEEDGTAQLKETIGLPELKLYPQISYRYYY